MRTIEEVEYAGYLKNMANKYFNLLTDLKNKESYLNRILDGKTNKTKRNIKAKLREMAHLKKRYLSLFLFFQNENKIVSGCET